MDSTYADHYFRIRVILSDARHHNVALHKVDKPQSSTAPSWIVRLKHSNPKIEPLDIYISESDLNDDSLLKTAILKGAGEMDNEYLALPENA